VPVVATLHDHTLVCPAGGQRVHRAENHVCRTIDAERCVRCFPDSPFHDQIAFARLTGGAHARGRLRGAAATFARRFPRLAARASRAARRVPVFPLTTEHIEARLAAARRVFDQIDLFIAPSPSIASEFERLGIAPAKIRVSDYGFVPLMRNRRSESGRPLRIGYVGTIVWHKGVHVLIDAVRGLPAAAYEVKIFGDPGVFPEYAATLRAGAAGLPVHFMGAFDRERTADIYAQIDVLVVPSLWLENSPLVIHEAFMAGVPVIGARIGGIPDLVDDGGSGLLYDAASRDALAATLRRVVEDPARLATLATARPRVKPIADDAREWEAVYGELVRTTAPVERAL
jgi:glycosyltransferase involved in cell wall biosynthesis